MIQLLLLETDMVLVFLIVFFKIDNFLLLFKYLVIPHFKTCSNHEISKKNSIRNLKKTSDVDEVVEEARVQVQKSQGGIHLEFKKLQTGW
jgi:hypothetical protein